jgi:deferrochelatase/peroxidase EfeB
MTDKEDLQAASVANPSRRCLFKTAAVGAAGLAVGAAGGYLVSQQSNTVNAGHSTQSIDCHGAHQAGILNPAHQPCGIFTAFDITGKTRGELQKLFRIITDRIEFLTKGGQISRCPPPAPPCRQRHHWGQCSP